MLSQRLLFGLTRFIVGGPAQWVGCGPEPRQRIYFANHGSHLDTILLCAALPPELRARTHVLAAADYWGRNRLTRWLSQHVLNAVLIDREGGADPLAPALAALDRGGSIALFPEGTRTMHATPQKMRSGLYHLARARPDCELVPVYLENPNRALPKGAILPAPIACSVYFGAPLAFDPAEPRAKFLDRARDAIIALART